MANLAALRSLVYVYLGTRPTDPAYPSSSLNSLINGVANKLALETKQQNASLLQKSQSLTSVTREYSLPADFAGYVEVRLDDDTGSKIVEVRDEDLTDDPRAAFSIYGPDGAAKLRVNTAVSMGRTLWLKYSYWPAELAADADAPSWLPSAFHDLLAREAALDAFGLGAEGEPSMLFLDETRDRRALYWSHVGRRGVSTTGVR